MQPVKESEEMENVCGINLKSLDFNLVEATLQSIETKTLTPIIKEELKLKIQSKRLATGKEELPKTVFKEPEKPELTAEEEQKREFRRERNRVAATKCRNKRKYQAEHLKTLLAEEQLKNYALKRKLETLEKKKNDMVKKLKLDQPTSTYPSQSRHSPSPSPSPSQSSILQFALSSPEMLSQVPSPAPSGQLQISSLPLFVSPIPQSPLPQPVSPVPPLPKPQTNSSEPPSPLLVIPVTSLASPVASSSSHLQHTHQEFDTLYKNLPSTSSGIYDYEPLPRRYSEDIQRNLRAETYQSRRFSADARNCHFVTSYNHVLNQQQADTTAQTLNIELKIPKDIELSGEHVEKLEQSRHINTDRQVSALPDMELDLLSDEEFFRFENETIPFEQYQNIMQLNNNLPHESSDNMIATDGIKPDMPVAQIDGNETGEKFDQEKMQFLESYLIQLTPVLEDEAMVPECNQRDSFHGSPGSTSPTFY